MNEETPRDTQASWVERLWYSRPIEAIRETKRTLRSDAFISMYRFIAAVVFRKPDSSRSLRAALKARLSRYWSVLGALVLSLGMGLGVFLTTFSGLTPVALFVNGWRLQRQSPNVTEYGLPWTVSVLPTEPFHVAGVVGLFLSSVVVYYLQFADLEALLSDQSPVGALRESRYLVQSNPRGVFGYTVIQVVALATLLASLLMLQSVNVPVGISATLLLLTTSPLFLVYRVRFFKMLRDST